MLLPAALLDVVTHLYIPLLDSIIYFLIQDKGAFVVSGILAGTNNEQIFLSHLLDFHYPLSVFLYL